MRQEVLRPVDVAVALALSRSPGLGYERLSELLDISVSTAHHAVRRLASAGLVDDDRRVHRHALVEFLSHGLRYAFFAVPGRDIRGVPTAHSAPPLVDEIAADEVYVWPSGDGTERGAAIPPLYEGAPGLRDRAPELYEALALLDALRVGRARERKLALEHLERWIDQDSGS